MILGVDHLALSCAALEPAIQQLTAFGFRLDFAQPDLPNHPGKKPLLKDFQPTHGIAYMRAPAGVAIELVNHSAPLTAGRSPYRVLATGPKAVADHGVTPEDWDGLSAYPTEWAALAVRWWLTPSEEQGTRVKAVSLPVPDLAAATRFWVDGLGASRRAATGKGAWVGYRRPVASWSLEVFLQEGPSAGEKPMLDDAGFPCVALLTNRMDDDLEKATKAGGEVICPPYVVTVNGRPLTVAMLRGPAAEIVEFIQVK